MAKGRHSKSDALKNLQGRPGKRKQKKQTFTASDAKFGIPHGLAQEVRMKVRKMAHLMQASGVPIEFMRPMFERYCWHLQAARDAYKEMKGKPTVTGALGGAVKNPAAQIFKDNSAEARQLEARFDAIMKNTKPKSKEKDPLAEFFERGGKPYPVPESKKKGK